MDLTPAHLHLMLNHLPIVGAPLLLVLLLAGLARRSSDLVRAALIGTLLLAATGPIINRLGEDAEEQVEGQGWMQESLVEQHEERAEAAVIALGATGALALVALWLGRTPGTAATLARTAVAAGLLASTLLLGWTALAGGQIRHDELRRGMVLAPGGGADDD